MSNLTATLTRSFSRERLLKFWKSLRYSTYVMFHPFDGFWCLTREKRGSIAVANFIVIAMIFTEIMRLTLTNFQFVTINMEYFNAIFSAFSIIVPMFLWTLSNWSLTTLMDGKGKFKEIYMGTAYAFTPFLIINIVMIPISHVITFNEGVIYYFIVSFATVWSVLLTLVAMMQIHDYSLAKTFFSSFLTIIGIAVVVFIFLLFFSLISDGISYFVSLYKEITFRFL